MTAGLLRAAFFGDSLTLGTGDPDRLGWVGRLARSCPEEGLAAYNLGIRGQTGPAIAARWLTEARPRLEASNARLSVFMFGTNDAFAAAQAGTGAAIEEALGAATAIIREASGFTPVLLVCPPPSAQLAVNRALCEIAAGMVELAGQTGQPVLDLFTALSGDPVWSGEMAAGDGLHPGRPGYDLLADRIGGSSAWREAFAAAQAQ